MRQLLFGKLDPARQRKRPIAINGARGNAANLTGAWKFHGRDAFGDHVLTPADTYDTANGTTLLTPEWDKGNDDRDAIRSSLRLDEHKSASVIE